MAKRGMSIRARVLYDGEGRSEDRLVVVEGDRIIEVKAAGSAKADAEGWVTPAFIDAHSHIGMFREGEPEAESEGNDQSSQIMPCSDPLNSVYFDDKAFQDAVDFGVLYSCIVPGSGNIVGGRARVIRNFAEDRRSALVKDYGFKMALGYNPRSTTSWKGERPDTRMGTAGLLERRFDEALAKKEKAELARDRKLRDIAKARGEGKTGATDAKLESEAVRRECELELGSEDRALVELITGGKTVKVHVHKEDDALYLIGLRKKYGLCITADHCGDIFRKEIFDELAKAGIPVVYGPLGAAAYKVELKHRSWRNTEALVRSKADYGLMTDHPIVMTTGLRECLRFFLYAGLSEAAAISVITARNAAILGLDELGSVAAGKLASLLVWDRDPFLLSARPKLVMAEGRILRGGK